MSTAINIYSVTKSLKFQVSHFKATRFSLLDKNSCDCILWLYFYFEFLDNRFLVQVLKYSSKIRFFLVLVRDNSFFFVWRFWLFWFESKTITRFDSWFESKIIQFWFESRVIHFYLNVFDNIYSVTTILIIVWMLTRVWEHFFENLVCDSSNSEPIK